MPNRIFLSDTGFHPWEAFGSCGAFSKPGMAFSAACARGNPSAAAATLTDCINPRRDNCVVEWVPLVEESVFILNSVSSCVRITPKTSMYVQCCYQMRNAEIVWVWLSHTIGKKEERALSNANKTSLV